jgi:peptide deformylase
MGWTKRETLAGLTPGKGPSNVPSRSSTCNRWQLLMEVVLYPDPVLRRGGKEIKAFDAALRDLASQMLDAMYEEGGVGLAAPQVGIEHKLLVLNSKGDREAREHELVMVNPMIKARKGYEWGEEGCLSFPGIYAEVERSKRITVEFVDLDGKPQRLDCDDWLARIIQHEMDHLEGVLFVDRLTPGDRIRVRDKLQEMEDRYRRRVG